MVCRSPLLTCLLFSPGMISDCVRVLLWIVQSAGLGDDEMDEAAFVATAYRYDIAIGPHHYDKSS